MEISVFAKSVQVRRGQNTVQPFWPLPERLKYQILIMSVKFNRWEKDNFVYLPLRLNNNNC